MRQRRDDVLDAGLGGELDRRAPEAEPHGTQTHLVHRLLAGDVDDPLAASCDRRTGLDQQGRLADTRFAAEQEHGPGDEAATGHPVEFVDPGAQARLRRVRRAEFAEREDAAFADAPHGPRADASGARILDH